MNEDCAGLSLEFKALRPMNAFYVFVGGNNAEFGRKDKRECLPGLSEALGASDVVRARESKAFKIAAM
jgi:hypothetical protein